MPNPTAIASSAISLISWRATRWRVRVSLPMISAVELGQADGDGGGEQRRDDDPAAGGCCSRTTRSARPMIAP